MIIRKMLAIAVAILMSVPGWARSGVVGTVEGSESATVGGASLVAGTTVFSGDTITVGPRGKALLSFPGGGQLLLSANSQVQVVKKAEAHPIQFEVTRGLARFRGSEKAPVEGLLGDAVIRPAQGSAGVGFVTVLSPMAALIGAEKGDLLVATSHDESRIRLREGSAVTVRLVPDDSNTNKFAKRTHGTIVLLGVVVILAATAAAIAANEGEPAQSNKSSAVSPFKFP